MKKIFLIMLLFAFQSFAQDWNSTVTTQINEPNIVSMDAFANRYGIHVVVQNSNATNSIRYYYLSGNGSVQGSATIETSGGAEYPAIAGDNGKIYITYKLGSNLETRKQTYGYDYWTTVPDISIGNNSCNGIDMLYGDNGLNLVYAMRDNGNYFETYYYNLDLSDQWVYYKNVTDYGSEVGGVPSVTISDNRVHVSYNSGEATPPYIGEGVSKSRDKNLSTGSWLTPQLISDGEYDDNTSREKLEVRGDKVFCIFYDNWVDLGQFGYKIQVKSRDLTGTSWPGSYTQIFEAGDPRILMGAETTTNGNLNVVYYYFDNGIVQTDYDGNYWSDDFQVSSDAVNYERQHLGFTTTSNDLFVLWKSTSSSYIKYRQKDEDPLAPQGLTISVYQVGGSTYPKLNWTLNNEPDVFYQENAYEIERRISYWGGPWTSWTVIGYKDGDQSEYIDFSIGGVYAEAHTAEYRIRAKDLEDNYSGYSSTVSINFSQFYKLNQGIVQYDYKLNQNYPNPFNPTTQIDYSIKSAGLVTLKVYDVLGTEVATLVNERKEPGNYSVEFNAGKLPSGIYFYTLTSGKFTNTKKLILLR